METLLAAATREDELVTKLLRAFTRNDRGASAEIGRSTLLTQGAYQDKLLESHRR